MPLLSAILDTKLEVLEDITRCDIDLLDLLKPGNKTFMQMKRRVE